MKDPGDIGMFKRSAKTSTFTNVRSFTRRPFVRFSALASVVLITIASAAAFARGTSASPFAFVGSVGEFFGISAPAQPQPMFTASLIGPVYPPPQGNLLI